MTFEEFTNRNVTEGLQVPFQYVNSFYGGLFMNLVIFMTYLVIALGVYFNQRRRSGEGDIAASFAVAGFITSGFTIFMSFVPGLVNIVTLSVVIVVTILSVIWLFFSKDY